MKSQTSRHRRHKCCRKKTMVVKLPQSKLRISPWAGHPTINGIINKRSTSSTPTRKHQNTRTEPSLASWEESKYPSMRYSATNHHRNYYCRSSMRMDKEVHLRQEQQMTNSKRSKVPHPSGHPHTLHVFAIVVINAQIAGARGYIKPQFKAYEPETKARVRSLKALHPCLFSTLQEALTTSPPGS